MNDNPFEDLFAGFSGTCALCGQSTFLAPRVVDSKAGKVHALCNLDIDKWRRWFKKKETPSGQ